MSLLRVEGLAKSFGGLRALRDVDVEIPEKEFFGIIGPNGAGKTTLFSVLAGQIRPTSGKVTFNGVDITGWSADRVASRGLVRTFQLMRPFESMTVLENVAVASHKKYRSVGKARRHAGIGAGPGTGTAAHPPGRGPGRIGPHRTGAHY